MYAISIVLPIAYSIGLLFTLKTHAYIYEAEDEEGKILPFIFFKKKIEDDIPEWSKTRCIVILIVTTALYSLISEQLVDSMEPTLHALGLKQAFVGVLLIGVTSNVSEIINGVSFGLQNKIALAMEVSSAATIQVLYNPKY